MKLFSLTLVILLIVFACSTEKNTLVNRSYHGMTAHYNGYFNANDLLTTSLDGFRASRKEDYYKILDIELLPNEQEIIGLLPSIDTAIAKCTKVIVNHSMPNASNPSTKTAEHNRWIDENWMTIGIANFYKKDFDKAQKCFTYINKFFNNDPSNYLASVWLVRTYVQLNNLTQAKLILKKLDKDLEELNDLKQQEKDAKKEKSTKTKSKKKTTKKIKDEEPKASFPKKTKYLLELVRAELLIYEENYDKAIEALEKALKLCKKSSEKARINYILGQLYREKSDNQTAATRFSKVLRYISPFEMNFSARINRAMLGGDAKLRNELRKMLRDDKNSEFKDQIYYALAEIDFKEGMQDAGKSNLIKSIFYSTSNNRQKAMCYERLGDFSYLDKDYINAQKYYDSCVAVLPESYPNGDVIRNKAIKLKDLVDAVETAYYEDSVLRIASMSEDDRERFAKKLVKKIQADEEKRKLLEDAKLKQLQAAQMQQLEANSTTKFFWNNAKAKTTGLEVFRKQWGQRVNEDDWRRSEKVTYASLDEGSSLDSTSSVDNNSNTRDTLSAESLLSKLPLTDSTKAASYERMFAALFDAGVIYKEQLNETKLAAIQFDKIVSTNVESKYVVLALFQLYKLNESYDPTLAYQYKERILRDYPKSDYAKYLSDPEFFVKQKEFEKLNEDDFTKMLTRYNKGLYSLVISSSDDIIENHPENPYRSKYMLLTALSVGQLNSNKKNMIPILKRIVAEYPSSDEEKRAIELLELIDKGYSVFEESNFNKKFIYQYNDTVEQWIIIFLPKNTNSMLAKSKLVDYNKVHFSKDQLNVSSKIYGTDQSIIVIKKFNEFNAKEYIRKFKLAKKELADLNDEKIYIITQDNLRILFETQKLEEFDLFYTEFY
jgi:tetratricopeptide (TPR) repeat protein